MGTFEALFAGIGDRFPVVVSSRAGPLALQVLFSGSEAASRIAPTFLSSSGAEPSLRVHFLTTKTHDLSPWVPDNRAASMRHDGGPFYVLWHPSGVLYAVDRQTGSAIVWSCDASFPAWECSRPALPVIQSTLRDSTWLPIHGAGIGRNGKSLLLVGPGKVGKTTTALSCISAGWDYAGDDFVLVDVGASRRVEPLYASARMRNDMVASFSNLVPSRTEISADDDDLRHELRLANLFPADRFRGGKVAAILLPFRGGAKLPTIGRAKPFDAISTLLRTTGMFLPGWLDNMTPKFMALIETIPLFTIDTGMQPAAIPDVLERFLETR